MVEKNYNRKYKKWLDGDAFAIKIEEEGQYKGRYIILIRYENSEWEQNGDISFRAKISNSTELPKTKAQIEELDYIIVRITWYGDRLLPIDASQVELIEKRKKVKYYPDKYGNLNTYIFDIHMERNYLNILDEMIYLGNFKLKTPFDEYIPFTRHNAGFNLLHNNTSRLIKAYEDYNLQKSIIYDEKNTRDYQNIKTNIMPDPKEILEMWKSLGVDFTKEKPRKKDTLTYVGGEDKDPYEGED